MAGSVGCGGDACCAFCGGRCAVFCELPPLRHLTPSAPLPACLPAAGAMPAAGVSVKREPLAGPAVAGAARGTKQAPVEEGDEEEGIKGTLGSRVGGGAGGLGPLLCFCGRWCCLSSCCCCFGSLALLLAVLLLQAVVSSEQPDSCQPRRNRGQALQRMLCQTECLAGCTFFQAGMARLLLTQPQLILFIPLISILQAPTRRNAWATPLLRWQSCSLWAPPWPMPRSKQRCGSAWWWCLQPRQIAGCRPEAKCYLTNSALYFARPADPLPDQGPAARVSADRCGLAGDPVPQAPQRWVGVWVGGTCGVGSVGVAAILLAPNPSPRFDHACPLLQASWRMRWGWARRSRPLHCWPTWPASGE